MGSTPRPTQSAAASPAKGKAAAAPKKPAANGVAKRTGRKPAAKKGGRGKGRGQKKAYADPRVQAAYERQRELRDLYSQVAMAVKPALEELADQALKRLTENLDAHTEVPEYYIVQKQLDEQLERVLQSADREKRTRDMIAERDYELNKICTQKTYINSFDYQTEEFYDGAENRLGILAELRREGAPIDTPDLTYHYVDHIPYVSFLGQAEETEAAALGKGRKTKPAGKRKAEDQVDGQTDSKKLRHTGGLLASEQQPDGVPDSTAATPTPADEEAEVVTSRKDIPDLPAGAAEPDDYGVRSVTRRAKSPRNRFIVPPLFQWDSNEIGFRDSTNDSTRKATRAIRGKFIDTPNSNTWHWDHTVKDYDCRDYKDDTLDPELVKKHGLHPKLGLFLPSSTNEPEQPTERIDGTRPVVVVPDKNTTIHASRSTRPMKMDLMLKEDGKKSTMAAMLQSFCQNDNIDPEEIVSDEMRERERQVLERLAIPSDDSDDSSESPDHTKPAEADEASFRDAVSLILEAAESCTSKPADPSPGTRPSRPYDAVRDVFTSAEPAPSRSERQPEYGTDALSILADMADGIIQRQKNTETRNDSSMIDPRLLGSSSQPAPPPTTFLQTALNPQPTFTHIAPAPVAIMEVPQQSAPPRIPFTSQNNARDSPILPPLRPNRADTLGKNPNGPQVQQPLPLTPHRPQEFGSPRGLVHTNSGAFFAPAPSRPFHQGLSFHEPLMQAPMQQGLPISGPGMMLNQAPLPQMSAYAPVMSPPLQTQPPLAPMSAPMDVPVPSTSPSGPPMGNPSSPAHTPRNRGSAPSNGNASGKYRKIAAAPIPHNRPWPSNGGTELRLAHYDHKEAIKDYRANEPPPRSGPTTIRGWNVNNVSKGRNRNVKKEDSEEKESPNMISPYISKWNASDRN